MNRSLKEAIFGKNKKDYEYPPDMTEEKAWKTLRDIALHPLYIWLGSFENKMHNRKQKGEPSYLDLVDEQAYTGAALYFTLQTGMFLEEAGIKHGNYPLATGRSVE